MMFRPQSLFYLLDIFYLQSLLHLTSKAALICVGCGNYSFAFQAQYIQNYRDGRRYGLTVGTKISNHCHMIAMNPG